MGGVTAGGTYMPRGHRVLTGATHDTGVVGRLALWLNVCCGVCTTGAQCSTAPSCRIVAESLLYLLRITSPIFAWQNICV